MSSLDSMDHNIDIGSIVLRTQKKLSSMFVTRKTIGPILDEDSKKLLNSVYQVFKESIGKKDAHKLTSRWIKIIVKVGILAKNDQFNEEELAVLEQTQQKFRTLVKIILSFWTIDYTFEYSMLKEHLCNIEHLLQKVVERHMTDKNKSTLSSIFVTISAEPFLTLLFNRNQSPKMSSAVHELVTILEAMSTGRKL